MSSFNLSLNVLKISNFMFVILNLNLNIFQQKTTTNALQVTLRSSNNNNNSKLKKFAGLDWEANKILDRKLKSKLKENNSRHNPESISFDEDEGDDVILPLTQSDLDYVPNAIFETQTPSSTSQKEKPHPKHFWEIICNNEKKTIPKDINLTFKDLKRIFNFQDISPRIVGLKKYKSQQDAIVSLREPNEHLRAGVPTLFYHFNSFDQNSEEDEEDTEDKFKLVEDENDHLFLGEIIEKNPSSIEKQQDVDDNNSKIIIKAFYRGSFWHYNGSPHMFYSNMTRSFNDKESFESVDQSLFFIEEVSSQKRFFVDELSFLKRAQPMGDGEIAEFFRRGEEKKLLFQNTDSERSNVISKRGEIFRSFVLGGENKFKSRL